MHWLVYVGLSFSVVGFFIILYGIEWSLTSYVKVDPTFLPLNISKELNEEYQPMWGRLNNTTITNATGTAIATEVYGVTFVKRTPPTVTVAPPSTEGETRTP